MDRWLIIRNSSVDNSDSEFCCKLFEGHSLDAVAICCILLASKFDEIDDNIPMIDEFCKAHMLVKDSVVFS